MTKLNKKTARTIGIVVTLILVAYVFRFSDICSYHPDLPGLIRAFIYLGLYMAWGVSFRDRIIQTQARRYLTAIASLMVFWFVVRTLKYHFVSQTLQPDITRYLWYMYYLAMLFIPLLAVFVAMSIGKPEEYRLPKQTALLYIPATVLFMLVITNDLHQLVFTFPESATVWVDSDYGYAIVSYIIVGWQILCALVMLVVMYVKCRIPGRRKQILLPCVPICILLIYMGFYCSGSEWLRLVFGDLTAITCLIYAATLEICIQCGFIQANTHYEDVFASAAYISAQITDENYIVRYMSRDAKPIPEEQMRKAENAPVMLSDGKMMHNMPIHGGHAIWTEDISELLNLREKLEETKEELKDRNALLQYEYEREKEHKVVEEQNRLYDMLQSKTQTQLDKISRLVSVYQQADSADIRKRILPEIVVLGSFIKRRKDFVLSIDSTPTIPESKLIGALGESFRALALMNIKGSYLVHTGKEYLFGDVLTLAYDFFEDAVEVSLDSLRSISARVFPVNGRLRVSIFADGDGAFETLAEKYPSAAILRDEDGVQLSLPLEGGGTV